ncbi:MAG: MlaD family protein [Candidatus Glassbacteria bacterium]
MPSRNARYRKSEIKAGVWIFFALVLFTGILVAISGAKFWKELDHYRVRLNYVGGLEVGSPVRMGGVLVGKVSSLDFISDGNNLIELTIEVQKGLPVKDNTTAYLSFISITSEQHLELEQNPAAAPLLSPGDLIASKELTTMDEVMEHVGVVGDTLQVILSRVNRLLKPENLARIDSIVTGLNSVIYDSKADFAALMRDADQTVLTLDSLTRDLDRMVTGNDTLLRTTLADASQALNRASSALAQIDTTIDHVDRMLLSNSSNIRVILDNLNTTSENLKEFSNTVKENPFLLFRAIPRQERKLGQ